MCSLDSMQAKGIPAAFRFSKKERGEEGGARNPSLGFNLSKMEGERGTKEVGEKDH